MQNHTIQTPETWEEKIKIYPDDKKEFIVDTGIHFLEHIVPLVPKTNQTSRDITLLQQKINDLTSQLIQSRNQQKDIYLQEQEQFSKRLTSMREQINQEHRDIYLSKENQLQQLSSMNDTLRQQIAEIQSSTSKQIAEIQSITKTQYDSIINEKNTRIAEYQSRLAEKDAIITEFRSKQIDNTRSVTRGEIGENLVIERLRQHWNHDWDFTKSAKESASMDIAVFHALYDIKGGIEVKNFTGAIPKRDIDKFKRDLVLREDYMFGIMISLNTGISNYPDFHIELCSQTQKPRIFVGNANQQKDIFCILESFLKYFFYRQKQDKSHNYQDLLLQEFTESYREYDTIRKNAETILTIAQDKLKKVNEKSIRLYGQNLKDNVKQGKRRLANKEKPMVAKFFSTNKKNVKKDIYLFDEFESLIEYCSGETLSLNSLEIYIFSKFDESYTDYQKNRQMISLLKKYVAEKGWDSTYLKKKRCFTNIKLSVPINDPPN